VPTKKREVPPPPVEIELLGDRIRFRRKQAHLTVTALAEKASMDKSQVSRIETGKASEGIEAATIIRLARALGSPVGWIIANEGDPGPVPVFKDGGDRRRKKPRRT